MTEQPTKMPDLVDEMQQAAEIAIETMKTASITARRLHAKAELMRHMRGTALKMAQLPADEAAARVAREWMQAWHLDDGAYADLAPDIARFTRAFCDDARGSTPTTQRSIREAIQALDTALANHNTSLADQMAWRSECAHGWWELVAPTPSDFPNPPQRPSVSRHRQGTAFWDTGCAERCRPTV